MSPSDAAHIPAWAWALITAAFVGGLSAFSAIIVYFIKRELQRLEVLLKEIPVLITRVTVLETKIDLRGELRDGMRDGIREGLAELREVARDVLPCAHVSERGARSR